MSYIYFLTIYFLLIFWNLTFCFCDLFNLKNYNINIKKVIHIVIFILSRTIFHLTRKTLNTSFFENKLCTIELLNY